VNERMEGGRYLRAGKGRGERIRELGGEEGETPVLVTGGE